MLDVGLCQVPIPGRVSNIWATGNIWPRRCTLHRNLVLTVPQSPTVIPSGDPSRSPSCPERATPDHSSFPVYDLALLFQCDQLRFGRLQMIESGQGR